MSAQPLPSAGSPAGTSPTVGIVPDGPPGLPLIGNMWDMFRNALGIMEEAASYGDVSRLDFGTGLPGGMRAYLVVQPEHVKHVLIDNHRNYPKSRSYDKMRPFMGNGLLLSDGDFWKRQRRLANPAFHKRALESIMADVVRTTEELAIEWGDGPSERDVASDMRRLTLTALVRAMFGGNIGTDTAEEVEHHLDVAMRQAIFQMNFPFLPDRLPTSLNRQARRSVVRMHEIVGDIVTERRRSGEEKPDLLGLMMAARDEETGEGMTEEQLRDEMMTFFVAGHETTANNLAWTFYLLGRHAGARRDLHAELDAVAPTDTPDWEHIAKLQYTRQVIDESLRLYPPAWVVERQALDDDVIDGYLIEKGSFMLVSPWITQRSERVWRDPLMFDPSRFAPGYNKAEGYNRYSYFPFGAGPRMCIGKNLSILESVLILEVLCRRFTVTPLKEADTEALITLRPRNGLPCRVTPRS